MAFNFPFRFSNLVTSLLQDFFYSKYVIKVADVRSWALADLAVAQAKAGDLNEGFVDGCKMRHQLRLGTFISCQQVISGYVVEFQGLLDPVIVEHQIYVDGFEAEGIEVSVIFP